MGGDESGPRKELLDTTFCDDEDLLEDGEGGGAAAWSRPGHTATTTVPHL